MVLLLPGIDITIATMVLLSLLVHPSSCHPLSTIAAIIHHLIIIIALRIIGITIMIMTIEFGFQAIGKRGGLPMGGGRSGFQATGGMILKMIRWK